MVQTVRCATAPFPTTMGSPYTAGMPSPESTPNQNTGSEGSLPTEWQMAADLRGAIHAGAHPPGTAIPTERDLAQRYGVSRATARQAIGHLVGEGLVEARRPKGHFVRSIAKVSWPAWDAPSSADYDRMIEEAGHVAQRDLTVSKVAADPAVAERLRVPEGTLVVVRRRLYRIDGKPHLVAASHFPLHVAAGRPHEREEPIPADQMIAGMVRHDDEIEGRGATEEEVRALELPLGLPVLVHTRTSYLADGSPCRVIVAILPVDRHRIRYSLDART